MISFIENLQQETQVSFTVNLLHKTLIRFNVYFQKETLMGVPYRYTRNTDKLNRINLLRTGTGNIHYFGLRFTLRTGAGPTQNPKTKYYIPPLVKIRVNVVIFLEQNFVCFNSRR
jgi:hypothetical protein